MGRKHPIIATIYDRFTESEERKFLGQLRTEVVGLAQSTVVEIGAGTGRNFPYYRAAAVRRLDAVEPDPYMRRRARTRAVRAGLAIEMVEATAEHLPFADDYADTVVCTLVLCSVDEPRTSLVEIQRVLKPGGQLLFIEHVRSDESSRARLQDWITPVWRRIAGNCHVNRASVAAMQHTGFAVRGLRRITGGPWGNPIIAGVATLSQ